MSKERLLAQEISPTITPEKPEDSMTVYYGKATDAISRASRKGLTVDSITGEGVVNVGDVRVELKAFESLPSMLGANTHKTLMAGVAEFTKLNGETQRESGGIRHTVTFPLEEYARLRGYRIDEEPTTTEEEAKREKNRANNALKRARRDIRDDLEKLRHTSLTWKEKTKGKAKDFLSVSIIGTHGIRSGMISMTFDPVFSEYLLHSSITQYPKALLTIDGRNQTAYNIGVGMHNHYSKPNNQSLGTHDRLIVSTILKYTNLPTYEEVLAEGRSWQERIKEPFETALDELVRKGALIDWSYGRAKGEMISDEEMETLLEDLNYYSWADFRVYFEPFIREAE